MALNVQMYKVHNALTNEDIVIPRLVNQQSLDFNELCEYLADGSTVTAADVSAVMKQIEMRPPLVLGLNANVVCSPEGLTFRPEVYRELTLADLSIGDLTASIAIEMPKKWDERFKSKATFKRVTKATTEVAEDNEEAPDDNTQGGGTDNTQSGGTDNTQGGDQGGGNSSITPGEGD